MRKFLYSMAALLCLCGGGALGDYLATQGSGTTFFDFICFSTKHCPTATLVTSAGSETGIAALPLQVSIANTAANATAVKVDNSAVTQPVSGTVTAAQGTAANLNATVVGTGTFAVQAASTLAAETTKVIGTVRNLGNAGAITDFAGQNAASPANSWLIGGQFNTTPTTLTNGNASPLQLDNAGNLLVNIKAGASSGAVAQGSTTSGQTGSLVQCAVTTAAPTYTTAQTNPLSCDTAGSTRVTVTNANANGQAAMAASSPVVLASNQTVADPCTFQNKTSVPINQNGTASVQLVGLSGSTVIYVCSLSLIAAGATTVAITTGTGSACVTGNAAVIGSTTANIANSLSLAANGGLTLGNGGATIAKGAASSELCMVLGSNVFVSGNLTYIQQ